MAPRIRHRIRDLAHRAAGLAVAGAVFGFGALALAQAPGAQTSDVQASDQESADLPTPAQLQARAERRAKTAAAVSEALSAHPIAADRVAMGRRLVKAKDTETSLGHMLDVRFARLRTQMLADLPAETPAPRQAAFAAALDEAVAEAKANMLGELLNGLARYYALRVAPESLTETATFLESPLGRRWIASPTTMSEADGQALGEYGRTHPALIEVFLAVAGDFDVTAAIMHPGGVPLAETVRVRLCRSLKTRGVTAAACADAR
jgi:hypothetical protein